MRKAFIFTLMICLISCLAFWGWNLRGPYKGKEERIQTIADSIQQKHPLKAGSVGLVETDNFGKLPNTYLVSFGDPEAPLKITEYFSFFCPYCLSLFREDFTDIKREYIDTGKVYWTFHPVPMDALTVQGMHCLEGLSDVQKRVFLQVYLEEAEIGDPEFCSAILQKAMEVFGCPVPQLADHDYLEKTKAFQEAFLFVKEGEVAEAVPSVEVNGVLSVEDVPDRAFVQRMIFREGV